ncbi:MAG: hypothetical protein HY876_09755 [Coriobacteriales bacterium]|nr:hypothetical protein [Coriobacteriales bacterium]
MIQNLERNTLLQLARHDGYPAVSLFMPTHHTGAERLEDRLRLKNLLSEAQKRLVEGGMRAPEAEALLAKAKALYDDSDFWRDLGDGLAVFIATDTTECLKVATTLPEHVVAGPRFYLRPLMPAWAIASPFFVLALSQGGVRLYRGNQTGLEPMTLPEGTPTSLEEELKYDQKEESLQYKVDRSVGGAMAVEYHGHGGEKDARLSNLLRFVEHVAKGVETRLGDSNSPLIVAGVDFVVDAYRDANAYPYLEDARISGSPDEMTQEQLHKAARDALRDRFDAPVVRELAELEQKTGSALASHAAAQIAPAAAEGRIRVLFVSDGVGPLGTMDPSTFAISQSEPAEFRSLSETSSAMGGLSPDACTWDLVDLAISHTLMRDGTVRAFSGENAPVRGVAALYRY